MVSRGSGELFSRRLREGVMRPVVAVFTVAVVGFAVVPQIAVGALIERLSVAADGIQANGGSVGLAISADGR